jgi:prolyl 4-hydroxylase
MWVYFALVAVLILITWAAVTWRNGGRGFTEVTNPWEPPAVVDSVLSRDDCKYLMEKANSLFAPSNVVGIKGPDSSRTSETAWIPKDDPVARKVFEKACELTGKSMNCCEDLQVVRYKPGTYYKAHHDSCCDESDACKDFEKLGGQRVGTLLVYLNEEFTDGETHFPDHGDVKMKAPPGSAIFFRPLAADAAQCHPKALHAGLPISSGTKYVCNAWVRENNFSGKH